MRTYSFIRVARLICLLVAISSTACIELTPVRRTALVPTAYVPTRSGAPLEAHETSLSGEISSVTSPQLSNPDLGDPGLLVPDLQVGGSVYHGFTSWLELGVQARYASYHWTTPNIEGVLPFPTERAPDIFMYGLGARLNKKIANTRTTLSAMAELNVATIYQARYYCALAVCDGGTFVSSAVDQGFYGFDGFDKATVGFSNFFVSQSTELTQGLHLFTLFGAEKHYKNVGFDTSRESNPLFSYLMTIAGAGLEYKKNGFGTTLTMFLPFENESALEFGPSVQLQTGLRF
jgi:hypothetical protein